MVAYAALSGAALSSAGTTGCALHGASLSLVSPRESNQREGDPDIRVLLRKTPLPPALLRGPSRRDVPVPSLLARRPASRPPAQRLRSASRRGAESEVPGSGWFCCAAFLLIARTLRKLLSAGRLSNDESKALCVLLLARPSRHLQSPLSEGRVESVSRGASGMDVARGLGVPPMKGQGWPLRGDARSSDETREVERSEARMQGRDFLVPFGGPAIRAIAKRNSPSRAKPKPFAVGAVEPPAAKGAASTHVPTPLMT
jgi:hypothetical protein